MALFIYFALGIVIGMVLQNALTDLLNRRHHGEEE